MSSKYSSALLPHRPICIDCICFLLHWESIIGLLKDGGLFRVRFGEFKILSTSANLRSTIYCLVVMRERHEEQILRVKNSVAETEQALEAIELGTLAPDTFLSALLVA